jgi:hypothetical protein
MIIKVLTLRLISVILALSCPIIVSAQQSKVIKFVSSNCETTITESNGDSRALSFTLDDRNILVEGRYPYITNLFTAEALISINHKLKTYKVQSYDELEAGISERAKSQEHASDKREIQFKLTEETDTMDGFRVRKIIMLGKPKLEMWVTSDLIPVRLRTFGERLKAIFPADFWEKVLKNPEWTEIIMLYGVPLKIAIDDHSVCRAEIQERTTSNSSFEVPADYKRVKPD